MPAFVASVALRRPAWGALCGLRHLVEALLPLESRPFPAYLTSSRSPVLLGFSSCRAVPLPGAPSSRWAGGAVGSHEAALDQRCGPVACPRWGKHHAGVPGAGCLRGAIGDCGGAARRRRGRHRVARPPPTRIDLLQLIPRSCPDAPRARRSAVLGLWGSCSGAPIAPQTLTKSLVVHASVPSTGDRYTRAW